MVTDLITRLISPPPRLNIERTMKDKSREMPTVNYSSRETKFQWKTTFNIFMAKLQNSDTRLSKCQSLWPQGRKKCPTSAAFQLFMDSEQAWRPQVIPWGVTSSMFSILTCEYWCSELEGKAPSPCLYNFLVHQSLSSFYKPTNLNLCTFRQWILIS